MPGADVTAPVIVTGGRGFVGRWLVSALRTALPGTPVIVTSRSSDAPGTIRLDITDAAEVSSLITAHRPRAIVHLAGEAFVPAAQSAAEVYRTNVNGTRNLVEATLRDAPDCRFVFVSSSEVYGGSFRAGVPLSERALLEPLNIYAAAKAAADLMVGTYALQGLQAVRFRPFNHFGPGQSDRFALASFASQIVAAERDWQPAVVRTGNTASCRDFLDVRDVAAAYVAAILCEDPLPPGTILNLASGVTRRIGDVLTQMIAMARVPLTIEQDVGRARATDIPLAAGDAAKATELLGWSPSIAFEQTITDLLASLRGR